MRLTVVCCCYFKKYVAREIAKASGVTYQSAFRPPRHIGKRKWFYTEDRPWSGAEQYENKDHGATVSHKELVEPIKEWKIFKGDRVEVLVGKDKGKHGLVGSLIKERNLCFVLNRNCIFVWQHRSRLTNGVMTRKECPLLVTTEVALVDPTDNMPTDVEWRYTEKGDKARVSVNTGRIIPIPAIALDQGEDYVIRSTYVEQDKDTRADDLKKITYVASMRKFNEDIMEEFGITDDRRPALTYWY